MMMPYRIRVAVATIMSGSISNSWSSMKLIEIYVLGKNKYEECLALEQLLCQGFADHPVTATKAIATTIEQSKHILGLLYTL